MRQEPVPSFILCVESKADPIIGKIKSIPRIADSLIIAIDIKEGIPDEVRSLPCVLENESRKTYAGLEAIDAFIRRHEPLPPPPPPKPTPVPKLRVPVPEPTEPPTPRPSLDGAPEPTAPLKKKRAAPKKK